MVIDSTQRGVSVSWISFHRRSDEIAEVLGIRPLFFSSSKRLLPLRYIDQFRATRQALKKFGPEYVVVMQPPAISLLAVKSYVRGTRSTLIGDLHSGVFFDPKWKWALPWVMRVLRRYGGAVVPNEDLKAICETYGVKAFVCHGLVRPFELSGNTELPASVRASVSSNDRVVLSPLAYAYDEPVEAILEAARIMPEVVWVLTGKAPPSVLKDAPMNCIFPGHVPSAEYEALRSRADIVLALTSEESTMQSAGYEALAAATPLVTARTRVLHGYFGESAKYVTSLEAEDIASAVQGVLGELESWKSRITVRRREIVSEQHAPGELIREWIQSRS